MKGQEKGSLSGLSLCLFNTTNTHTHLINVFQTGSNHLDIWPVTSIGLCFSLSLSLDQSSSNPENVPHEELCLVLSVCLTA